MAISPTYPTPSGGDTTAPLGTGKTAQQYAQELDAKYPGQHIGAEYLKFVAAHPGMTPLQAGDAWALSLGLAGFGADLKGGITGTGTAVGQIAAGSEKGAEIVSNPLAGIEAFLKSLTDPATWRSVGWVVLGVALIITGLVTWLKQKDILPGVVPVPI